MLLFSGKDKKRLEAQGFLTRIINNNCTQLIPRDDESRSERRLNITLPTYLIPIVDGKLEFENVASAVTKEICSSGLSLTLSRPLEVESIAIWLRWNDQETLLRARIHHSQRFGAGIWQIGVEVLEMLPQGDYPDLQVLDL